MNANQTNNNYYSDEINLQDIFLAIWRKKILIIVITLIAAIATGLFSVFALTPVYNAKLNIIINMPETYQTKYGDYTLPISTNEQYINLITSNDILRNTIEDMGYDSNTTIESLRDRISIKIENQNTTQNSFEILVAADNPEEARQLAQALYNNYVEFIDVLVVEGAVDYFIDYYTVQLKSMEVELETNRVLLEKNTELLENTPMIINQKEAMNEVISSGKISDIIIMENIINPNYTALELDIIEIKQTINTIESTIDLYNSYLDELQKEKDNISDYYKTGEFNDLKNKIISITKSNIYLPSEPVAPSRKTSPNNLMNVVIGALLGGMISVFVALIKEFWFKKEERE